MAETDEGTSKCACSECGSPLEQVSESSVCGECSSKRNSARGWSLPMTITTGFMPAFALTAGLIIQVSSLTESRDLSVFFLGVCVAPIYAVVWSFLYLGAKGHKGWGGVLLLGALMTFVNVLIVFAGCAAISPDF